MKRKDARKQAFEIVFEREFHSEFIEEIIANATEARDYIHDEYSRGLIDGVIVNLHEIDEKIREKCINWRFERISRVALAIMRIALYEIFFVEDVDVSVSVNEAVELAKDFGSDEDPSFVNGILGAVIRSYLPNESGNLPVLPIPVPQENTNLVELIHISDTESNESDDNSNLESNEPKNSSNSELKSENTSSPESPENSSNIES